VRAAAKIDRRFASVGTDATTAADTSHAHTLPPLTPAAIGIADFPFV
jgi:hypothetical protein